MSNTKNIQEYVAQTVIEHMKIPTTIVGLFCIGHYGSYELSGLYETPQVAINYVNNLSSRNKDWNDSELIQRFNDGKYQIDIGTSGYFLQKLKIHKHNR